MNSLQRVRGTPRYIVGVALAAWGVGSTVPTLVAQRPVVATQSTSESTRAAAALLARHVTVHFRGVSLQQAIDTLSRMADVVIEYQTSRVTAIPTPVTLDVVNAPLGVALERALEGTSLRVIPGGPGTLTVVAAEGVVGDSLGGTVIGRIVDSVTGRGVKGATVKVVGTKFSTLSTDSGRFTLNRIPSGDFILSARAFGYRPGERSIMVAANERVTIRIALATAPNVLSGVVTTATGVQERRAVGNDITVINADSVMRVAPVTSVTDLLATRVPGLTVARTSGAPGAPSRIRLRGIGGGLVPGAESMSNDPIVIVDGIRVYARQSTTRDQNLAPNNPSGTNLQQSSTYPTPSALDQIDPNSIATIEVLKGPSATSQWGSDAGNGVIVITTKRGRAGATQVSASLVGGVTYMPGVYAAPGYYPYGKTRYFQDEKSSFACGIFAGAFPGPGGQCVTLDSVARFQAANSDRLSPFATGMRTEGSATVSGGSSTLTYSLTGSASNDLGYSKMPSLYQDLYRIGYGTAVPSWMRRPNVYKTWGANATVGIVPTPQFEATLGASVTTSDQRQTSADNNLSALAGTYIDTASLLAPGAGAQIGAGIAAGPYTQKATSHDITTAANADVRWNRWAWLPVRVNGGVQVVERQDRRYNPFGLVAGNSDDTLGHYALGQGRVVTRSGNAGTTVPIGGVLQTAVGGNVAITTTEDFAMLQDTLAAGIAEPTRFRLTTQSSTSFTTAGWYVEPRLNAGSRIFVSPGFRFDGGSGSSHASGGNGAGGLLSFFPKLNFSWIAIDREGQAPLAGVLTLLRPRVAFGIAGVQPEPQMRERLFSDGLAPPGPGQVYVPAGGVQVSALGNPDLHPERSREVEGGFDASFWRDRVSTTLTFYSKMRTDAIQQITTALSVYGGQPFYINVGRVRNTGTELQLNARIVDASALTWDINGSLSSYRDKLVTLYGGSLNYSLTERLVQGYPMNGYWARPIVGYHDVNHNGKISLDEISIADSAVFIGGAQPRAEIPFSTSISLWNRRLTLNAAFDYKRGVTQLNSGGSQLLTNLYADTSASLGQQAIAVAAYVNQSSGCSIAAQGTCYGLFETVNVLRFNTMSVTLPIADRLSTRFLHVPHASVSLQGSNMGLWTTYHGKDPDVNANVVGESLSDTGQLPLPRTWTLRIDLRN